MNLPRSLPQIGNGILFWKIGRTAWKAGVRTCISMVVHLQWMVVEVHWSIEARIYSPSRMATAYGII